MPFHYERDDARRRAVFTFYGEFKEEEGVELLDKFTLEGIENYGFLYDLRRQDGSPTMRELRSYTQTESSTVAAVQGSRGAIAIVTNNSRMYCMACAYAQLARPKIVIQVFRELSDAERWLAAQSA